MRIAFLAADMREDYIGAKEPQAHLAAPARIVTPQTSTRRGVSAPIAPRGNVRTGNMRSSRNGQLRHRESGAQTEIVENQQLAASIPAFDIVARIGPGKAAGLRLAQGLGQADAFAGHRVKQEICR